MCNIDNKCADKRPVGGSIVVSKGKIIFALDALRHHNAASKLSLIRNIVINVARQHSYDSLTKAQSYLSLHINQLISLLE